MAYGALWPMVLYGPCLWQIQETWVNQYFSVHQEQSALWPCFLAIRNLLNQYLSVTLSYIRLGLLQGLVALWYFMVLYSICLWHSGSSGFVKI